MVEEGHSAQKKYVHRMQRDAQIRIIILRMVQYLICSLAALFVLAPILVALVGSLRTSGELLNDPFSIPSVLHWENYGSILTSGSFWLGVMNSIITTLATVALLLLITSPPAFVFARMRFRGSDILFNVFLLGLLFPLTVAILPLYVTIRDLNLLDTLFAVILPQVAFGVPMTILILRNFFAAIPQELEDAAYIDGCSYAAFFWFVLLPLARPSLAAVGMLTMVSSWNGFLLPLLVLNNSELWTLPLGLMQFQGQYSTDWALIMAFVTLSMIPAVIFYLFAERYLISGLTAGAVKG